MNILANDSFGESSKCLSIWCACQCGFTDLDLVDLSKFFPWVVLPICTHMGRIWEIQPTKKHLVFCLCDFRHLGGFMLSLTLTGKILSLFCFKSFTSFKVFLEKSNLPYAAGAALPFRAAPAAYGSSWAKDQMRASGSRLHHSHSKVESKTHLWLTPQLMAILDP